MPKVCTCCGRVYDPDNWARLWAAQGFIRQFIEAGESLDEPAYNLQLVTCSCGSTIAKEEIER